MLSTVDQPLTGLTLVVDCAHGAAAAIGPDVYRRAGATVHAIGCEPDGWNINDGVGSTHLGAAHRGRAASRAPTSASPTTATPTAAWP